METCNSVGGPRKFSSRHISSAAVWTVATTWVGFTQYSTCHVKQRDARRRVLEAWHEHRPLKNYSPEGCQDIVHKRTLNKWASRSVRKCQQRATRSSLLRVLYSCSRARTSRIRRRQGAQKNAAKEVPIACHAATMLLSTLDSQHFIGASCCAPIATDTSDLCLPPCTGCFRWPCGPTP